MYEFPGAIGHCVTIAAMVGSVPRETTSSESIVSTYVHLQMRYDLETGEGTSESSAMSNGGLRYVPNRANEQKYFAYASKVSGIPAPWDGEMNVPHKWVSQLIVDRNVEGIGGRSLYERPRERAINEHCWPGEAVGGDIRVHDVEHIVHIGRESGDGEESELSEKLEGRGERNHFTGMLKCLAQDEPL